jgi:hypothetical protein
MRDGAAAMDDAAPARLRESPLALVRQALGGPRTAARKALRLGVALRAWLDGRALDARLERLRALGYLERVPSRLQLIAGAADMMRFWIVPAAQDYYQSKGLNFTFHQLLRFLDDPASLVDPTGFMSSRDVIIGHLMQVVHANPRYDFQLLESFPDGLEELAAQIDQMLAGTHPRTASIRAVVEDAGYHARLREYLREYVRDRAAPPPLRENVTAASRFADAEGTFGTLHDAMRYFTRLPSTASGVLRHLVTVRAFADSPAR